MCLHLNAHIPVIHKSHNIITMQTRLKRRVNGMRCKHASVLESLLSIHLFYICLDRVTNVFMAGGVLRS